MIITRKTAVDRGRTDRVGLTHRIDLDLQSPTMNCQSVLQIERKQTNGRTNGQTDGPTDYGWVRF